MIIRKWNKSITATKPHSNRGLFTVGFAVHRFRNKTS